MNTTLAIDLSSSFSTLSKNNGVQIRSISKGSCPSFNYIRFWTDVAANTVYAYGGELSYSNPWVGATTVPLEALWSFEPNDDGGIWQSVPQWSSVFSSITRPTQGSAASGAIGGFNLGGYAGSHTSQKTNIPGIIPIPGLQFYNFTSQEWLNFSATAYTTDGSAEYSGIAYVPTWGTAGLVVMFGGQTSPNISHFVDGAAYLSMSNISLFDPSTQSWYYQETMGDVPSQRDRFCVVGINGGDNSTYGTKPQLNFVALLTQVLIITSSYLEIFIYGGQVHNGINDGSINSQEHNTGFDEVFVLSLPSFVWFEANYTSSDPRWTHTCHIVGNRQMLSIGGLNPSAPTHSASINETDPFWEGVKVFDLTELQWTNHYNATAAPYLAPSAVAAHYAAGSRYPSAWSNNDLKSLFLKTPSNTSEQIQPSLSVSPQPRTSKRRNPRAAVSEGVVGGVAAVVIVGLAFYLLARKRANKKGHEREDSKLTPTSEVNEAGQAHPYETEGHALPPEVDSASINEADSRHVHELSSLTTVGYNSVHEM